MHRIVELPYDRFDPEVAPERSRELARTLEEGRVLYLPHIGCGAAAAERTYLDSRWLSGTHKSVSFDPARSSVDAGLRGAQGAPADLAAMAALLARFRADALALVHALFPAYTPHLRVAPTSLRPRDVEREKMSWRKDDTLLHVDAFPSRPNRGERILRVFANVDPEGGDRVWKIGDLFESTAREFLPRLKAPLPGSAALLHSLGITKSRRSLYDHLMLAMHDAMKQDDAYQRRASHLTFGFPPGAVWVCYSDQTAHAALAGRCMMEQTMHLPVDALYFPGQAPLRVLEALKGEALA